MTKNRIFRIAPPKPTGALNAFQMHHKLESAEAFARKHAPKPSSWWTAHAAPDAARSAFVAELNQRVAAREQKHGSTNGIALMRPADRAE